MRPWQPQRQPPHAGNASATFLSRRRRNYTANYRILLITIGRLERVENRLEAVPHSFPSTCGLATPYQLFQRVKGSPLRYPASFLSKGPNEERTSREREQSRSREKRGEQPREVARGPLLSPSRPGPKRPMFHFCDCGAARSISPRPVVELLFRRFQRHRLSQNVDRAIVHLDRPVPWVGRCGASCKARRWIRQVIAWVRIIHAPPFLFFSFLDRPQPQR